jgi:Tfp pilus assembly protein PilF
MSRIETLLEHIEKFGKDSFLQHALALEYIKLGDDDCAREQFNELLQREPGYVGSYYHLGKLLERAGEVDHAIVVYKNGMSAAKLAGDNHSLNELRSALDDIEN